MRLRSYSLRIQGAAGRAHEFRNPREVARRLGGLYATVRPDAGDLFVTVAVEVPHESVSHASSRDDVLHAAKRFLPADLQAKLVLAEEPDRAHELSAQLLEDKRRGTPALPGALQAPEDLEAWEGFLARAHPRGLIELGTATGAFSRWLSERVEWFRTIDIGTPEPGTPGFIRLDLWERAMDVRDLTAQAPRPFVLYCDNGDKPREVETFGPALEVGDFLAVHDYGTEIFEEDVPTEFRQIHTFGLTTFYEKERSTSDPRATTRTEVR